MLTPLHGGPDEHPVHVDLSTNGNPLGPSPMAKAALHTPIKTYPDPSYLGVRQSLAAHHEVEVDQVVVGAGATELIHRIVEVFGGPVAFQYPGFAEYRTAAQRFGQPTIPVYGDPFVPSLEAMGKAMREARVMFITQPGNPDALIRSPEWCEAVSAMSVEHDCILVWDLAYLPMTYVADIKRAAPHTNHSIHLFAPNKAHGCTGLRAGWLMTNPVFAKALRDAQISWVLSTPGAAFLQEIATPSGDAWVKETTEALFTYADELAADLQTFDLTVHQGDTTFVLAEIPHACEVAKVLRESASIKVRDATSLGMPGWWRIAGSPPETQDYFLDNLERVLEEFDGQQT